MRPDLLIVGDVASVHIRRLAAALGDAGLAIELAGFEGDEIPGVRIHRLGTLPVSADRRYALAVPRFARLLRARRPKVINAHYLTSYGVLAALGRWLAHPLAGRPALIQSTWGDDLLVTPLESHVHQRLARLALRAADAATGDSLDLESGASSLAPELSWQRFVFGPPASLLQAPVRPERLMLSARQLVPEMRVDRIIEAFQVASHAPDSSIAGWKLVVAGGGPEAGALATQASRDPQVEFTGPVSQADLQVLMLRASVGVSIPESDATSATLLESLAAGIVPIVNDLPANREWVDPGIGEIVSRTPSAYELADAMRHAAVRSVPVEQLRARVAGATWEAQIGAFVQLVHSLAADTDTVLAS